MAPPHSLPRFCCPDAGSCRLSVMGTPREEHENPVVCVCSFGASIAFVIGVIGWM